MSKITESQIQQALIKWARLMVGKYPELKYLYAIPNGANTTARNRARLIREGLLAGVSDLHLPIPKGGFIGLWIEMKTDKGKLSPSQLEWLNAMHSYGHQCAVARSWTFAAKVIKDYLNA